MSNATILACADTIEAAVRDRMAIGRLTATYPDLTLDEGYAIQDEVTARRLSRGETIVGAKLGLTSRAKQVQMNCAEPMYGRLFSTGFHPSNEPFRVDSLIHPRVEPEVVLVMGKRLAGPGVSAADVLDATEWVACGLEIIDSRYADFSFTAPDVVADNTSEARVVLGPNHEPYRVRAAAARTARCAHTHSNLMGSRRADFDQGLARYRDFRHALDADPIATTGLRGIHDL